MLQDAHCHLHHLKSPAAEQLLSGLETGGIGRVFTCATVVQDWDVIRELSARFPQIVPCYGVHSWFCREVNDQDLRRLEGLLTAAGPLMGEVGLDHACLPRDEGRQQEVFIKQLMIAKRCNTPLMVHCVRAWRQTLDALKAFAPGLKFCLHSFNGSWEIANEAAAMGGYLSFQTGALVKDRGRLRMIVERLPLSHLLIETDLPYQLNPATPEAYVQALGAGYEIIAGWRKMPFEDLSRLINDNGTVFADRAFNR